MSVNLATPGGAEFVKGYKGQIANLVIPIIGSRTNENATAVENGRAVAMGASGGCKPVGSSADLIAGISVMNPITPADYLTHAINFKQYEEVPLLEFGFEFVQPVEDWHDGDAVYGIVSQAGELGTARGGGASADRLLVPGASMVGAGVAGTIGVVKVIGGSTIVLTS